MEINLKKLRITLAENKVYDAWEYVQSLMQTLRYMNVTYKLILAVRANTKQVINQVNKEKKEDLEHKGQATMGINDFKRTNLIICGYEINDSELLHKEVLEFFHYARISMDEIFQIINIALLGDASIESNDIKLISKLKNKLRGKNCFNNVLKILEENKQNPQYKYVQAFDNYIKHIRTIPITIKHPFLLSEKDCFVLDQFTYNDNVFEKVDAIEKIGKIYEYTIQMINKILIEVQKQIPNCIGNNNRIQTLKFKMQGKELKGGGISTDYVSYFIEVKNGLEDLSSREIKVHPLKIFPNGEVKNVIFSHNKIFICKGSIEDRKIIGCATLKDEDEECLYRTYKIEACDEIEYLRYMTSFRAKYFEWIISDVIEGEMVVSKYPPTN